MAKTDLELVERRLRELNCQSVSELFARNPGVPFGRVLRVIAKKEPEKSHLDIPLLLLKQLYENEARETGTSRAFAIDTLHRSIVEHVGAGWRTGKNWDDRRARIFSSWYTPHEYDSLCECVWKALKELDPPSGWRPETVADSVLLAAFEKGWPLI